MTVQSRFSEHAVRFVDDHNVTSVSQALKLLLDDRSHGDDWIASAAVEVLVNMTDSEGGGVPFDRCSIINYVGRVFKRAAAQEWDDGDQA